MTMSNCSSLPVLDHGYVRLLNTAGPSGSASDIDPANVARTSFDQRDSGRTRKADLHLCDYLMRNHHTTPFEMVQVWLEMKLPIFVARQFVRHRTVSINEISGRYVELPAEWYIPPIEQICGKAANAKQGRGAPLSEEDAEEFRTDLNRACKMSYDNYLEYLNGTHGPAVAPELCRLFLHVNHYTKWVWRQDLHNLMHFLSLRDHFHAQWEAQEYARAITGLLRQQLPDLMSLYDKYRRQQ
jgi:thymidylate synthase (FAD)